MRKVIKVENLSKSYIIDHKVKPAQGSSKDSRVEKFSKELFWALNEVNFDVKEGDRVGIIGKNGAGKSTLLKILSRITEPTKGKISIKGKVASLLEVGTGFHPELTGRENIFLNGAILGMSKSEIAKKFDEIVDFSGVEQFLDTPVKRYSSGMYVRLAFAVGANLEPEILIVDEVLAVGDAAFQKKCMGKMQEAGAGGRTVLFVSHNIGQISSLCTEAILLEKGSVLIQGEVSKVVQHYYAGEEKIQPSEIFYENDPEKEVCITAIKTLNAQQVVTDNFPHNESISLQVAIQVNRYAEDILLGIHLYDSLDRRIFTTELPVSGILKGKKNSSILMTIPPEILTPNTYKFNVGLHIPNIQLLDEHKGVCPVAIYDNGSPFYKYSNVDYGCVFVKCEWHY